MVRWVLGSDWVTWRHCQQNVWCNRQKLVFVQVSESQTETFRGSLNVSHTVGGEQVHCVVPGGSFLFVRTVPLLETQDSWAEPDELWDIRLWYISSLVYITGLFLWHPQVKVHMDQTVSAFTCLIKVNSLVFSLIQLYHFRPYLNMTQTFTE